MKKVLCRQKWMRSFASLVPSASTSSCQLTLVSKPTTELSTRTGENELQWKVLLCFAMTYVLHKLAMRTAVRNVQRSGTKRGRDAAARPQC